MLIGAGADEFAASAGLEQVDPSYFFTERRWQGLVKQLKKEGCRFRRVPQARHPRRQNQFARLSLRTRTNTAPSAWSRSIKHGNIAAGTSTGGTAGQARGRIGDSPIIGAGTYASNQSCAVSGTGTGEYFIRLTVAREVCALVRGQGNEAAGRRR